MPCANTSSRASPAGPRSTAIAARPGRSAGCGHASSTTSGTSTTSRCGSISASCCGQRFWPFSTRRPIEPLSAAALKKHEPPAGGSNGTVPRIGSAHALLDIGVALSAVRDLLADRFLEAIDPGLRDTDLELVHQVRALQAIAL